MGFIQTISSQFCDLMVGKTEYTICQRKDVFWRMICYNILKPLFHLGCGLYTNVHTIYYISLTTSTITPGFTTFLQYLRSCLCLLHKTTQEKSKEIDKSDRLHTPQLPVQRNESLSIPLYRPQFCLPPAINSDLMMLTHQHN